jgi:methionyl-tRNA formyltransferase
LQIDRDATAGEITHVLADIGAVLMARALPMLADGTLVFHRQSAEGATYAHKIDKNETRIDWTQDAEALRNHIHGLSPTPGAYSEISIGRGMERIKFLRVAAVEASGPAGTVIDEAPTIACGLGALRVLEAQRAGKAAMSGEYLQRGAQIARGAKFV